MAVEHPILGCFFCFHPSQILSIVNIKQFTPPSYLLQYSATEVPQKFSETSVVFFLFYTYK